MRVDRSCFPPHQMVEVRIWWSADTSGDAGDALACDPAGMRRLARDEFELQAGPERWVFIHTIAWVVLATAVPQLKGWQVGRIPRTTQLLVPVLRVRWNASSVAREW